MRERIGKKVITALSRGDPAVSHAAVDMLCALIQPMHDDCDLFQEQQNKLSVLSSKNFLEQLLNMFTQHVVSCSPCCVSSSLQHFDNNKFCGKRRIDSVRNTHDNSKQPFIEQRSVNYLYIYL